MNSEHLAHLFEEKPLGSLSESELAEMQSHLENCAACRRAAQAAHLSSLLLKARQTEVIEPSPFFATTVMAALREQQKNSENSSLVRMWNAAKLLVYSMTAVVMLLIGLTVFNSGVTPANNFKGTIATLNGDAADLLIDSSVTNASDLSDDQVIEVIYSGE